MSYRFQTSARASSSLIRWNNSTKLQPLTKHQCSNISNNPHNYLHNVNLESHLYFGQRPFSNFNRIKGIITQCNKHRKETTINNQQTHCISYINSNHFKFDINSINKHRYNYNLNDINDPQKRYVSPHYQQLPTQEELENKTKNIHSSQGEKPSVFVRAVLHLSKKTSYADMVLYVVCIHLLFFFLSLRKE